MIQIKILILPFFLKCTSNCIFKCISNFFLICKELFPPTYLFKIFLIYTGNFK